MVCSQKRGLSCPRKDALAQSESSFRPFFSGVIHKNEKGEITVSTSDWPVKPSKESPSRARVRNPERVTGQMTGIEQDIRRIAREGIQQERRVYTEQRYEYQAPFNYPNTRCELGREGTGTGAHADGMELDIPPFGAVTVEEEDPIIAVDVIGSPCIPPATVLLNGEPLEWKYPRTGVRYKVNNLWGEHLYGWGASDRFDEGNRHSGLVSAHFEIPDCKKITVMGYGQLDVHVSFPGKSPTHATHAQEVLPVGDEMWWNDAHFNIHTIRVTVRVEAE
jgi:hypothetical protein